MPREGRIPHDDLLSAKCRYAVADHFFRTIWHDRANEGTQLLQHVARWWRNGGKVVVHSVDKSGFRRGCTSTGRFLHREHQSEDAIEDTTGCDIQPGRVFRANGCFACGAWAWDDRGMLCLLNADANSYTLPTPTYSNPMARRRTASRRFLVSTMRGRRNRDLILPKSSARNSGQPVPTTSASTPSAAA